MRRSLLWTIAICYAAFLVRVVLFKHHVFLPVDGTYGERFVESISRGNYVPFHTIAIYAKGLPRWAIALPNLLGNVFIFMPLGILLPLLRPSALSFWRMVLWGFCLSLALECIQLTFIIGTFDVDDVFLNTLGTVFGYACLKIVRRLRS
jgi:glycopeptide antibiotics resistance protein